jgi:hypothetical protein
MVRRISQVLRKKRKKAAEGQELALWLDQDSVQRLERLKRKFKSLDDSELIAFALKSLELQMIRVVKRRVLRRIRALEKKGLTSQQIADHLNKQGVPVPGQEDQWSGGTIARLSRREGMPNNSRRQEGGR